LPVEDWSEDEIADEGETKVNFNSRLTPTMVKRIEALADARGINPSTLVRWIFRNAIRDLEKKWGVGPKR